MQSGGIMILDSTGLLSPGQMDAGFEASILYLNHEHKGVMRFEHRGDNGTIESNGSYVWGGVGGERFTMTFDTITGEDNELTFLLPTMYHSLPVPKNSALFLKPVRKRGTVPKKAGQTVH